MISAAMIERLLNSNFTKDMILTIINADYISRSGELSQEMHDAMNSLINQCAVRKITESLKKERE